MMNLPIYLFIIIIVVCLIAAFIGGFFTMRAIFTKQLKENPPVNRDMIRAMYTQMGRKPSEKDVTRVMEAMNKYSTNPYTTPKADKNNTSEDKKKTKAESNKVKKADKK